MFNPLLYRPFWFMVTVLADGDGNYSSVWLKNTDCSPGSVYSVLDEAGAHNGDTDFALTDGVTGGPTCGMGTGAGKGSFTLQNPSGLVSDDTINRVRVTAVAKKAGAGTANFRVGVREAATDAFGATGGLSTSYVEYSGDFTTKPAGGAWTLAALNATEAIIETTALGLTEEARVTKILVEIDFILMPATTQFITGAGGIASAEAFGVAVVTVVAPPAATIQRVLHITINRNRKGTVVSRGG